MPPPDIASSLLLRLNAGVASSTELEVGLGLSQSTASRVLRGLLADGRVLRMGTTRGARYGLRREIAGIGSNWPLRRIDGTGAVVELGQLYALAAEQYYLEPSSAALAEGFMGGGAGSGLPYFLQDQRPGGFLGRAVPLRYPELQLPQRVNDWSDDHYLRYLTQRGSDTVSDLVLGDPAFDDYLALAHRRSSVPTPERGSRFPLLAAAVMEGGLPGSSAHGEHPKFATLLEDANGPLHVLVKFSPSTGTAVGQRWSDLLIAEYHAHEVLRMAGIFTARSRIFHFDDRTYLEVDRFDRAGLEGRAGVTSLLAIDAHLYGKLDNWIAAAARLHADGRIDMRTLERVRLVATFGGLIANTDRHFGNLAFFDSYEGRFQLAPVYDMLPMLFAPEHDQIVTRSFEPPDPTFETLNAWRCARMLAQEYWRRLVRDERISAGFRSISGACLGSLEALPLVGARA